MWYNGESCKILNDMGHPLYQHGTRRVRKEQFTQTRKAGVEARACEGRVGDTTGSANDSTKSNCWRASCLLITPARARVLAIHRTVASSLIADPVFCSSQYHGSNSDHTRPSPWPSVDCTNRGDPTEESQDSETCILWMEATMISSSTTVQITLVGDRKTSKDIVCGCGDSKGSPCAAPPEPGMLVTSQ